MKLFACLSLSLLLALPAAHAAPAKSKHKTSVKKKARKPVDVVGESVDFTGWKEVAAFEDEMVAKHGFTRVELDGWFKQAHFVESAVTLMKPAPPGKPKNWHAYRALMADDLRVDAGRAFWDQNADTLARAEAEYGVPAEIIVGILGVETIYGQITGRFRVMDALATLAFAYPETPNRAARMAFFRGELENTLLFAREYKLDPFSLQGSYAGAIGLPQFMPSSIRRFGVDFDQDGQIDLRNSPADAIGSVAHFLVMHGWQRNDAAPYVQAAQVSPSRAWESLLNRGLTADLSLAELAAAGVTPANGDAPEQPYGLVDLQNGADPTDYWLASRNFFAITQYNRSYFYAMAVLELGHTIRAKRAP